MNKDFYQYKKDQQRAIDSWKQNIEIYIDNLKTFMKMYKQENKFYSYQCSHCGDIITKHRQGSRPSLRNKKRYCKKCYMYLNYEPRNRRCDYPKNCSVCGIETIPRKRAKGMCKPCYSRALLVEMKARSKNSWIRRPLENKDNCLQCKAKMSHSLNTWEYGYVLHGGKGLCQACYAKQRYKLKVNHEKYR